MQTPAWFGYSIGTWDRNAFVVDTRGFNDRSWLHDYGLPHSEALHTTERFERRDFGHMDLLITIDDPQAYTRLWSFTLHFELNADTEWIGPKLEARAFGRLVFPPSRWDIVPVPADSNFKHLPR